MRRALASLLVAIFGFLTTAPAIFADDASNLPACCRRFGKHHCLMLLEESGGPALKGVCASYNQRPSTAVVNPGISTDLPAVLAPRLTPAPATVQPLALLGTALGASRFTRGPPAS